MSTKDLECLVKQDLEVRNEIENFAALGFNRVKDQRTKEEKSKLASETTRLDGSFKTAERQRLMLKAELKSAQAATTEIEKQTTKIIEGSLPLDPSWLQSTVKDLELSIANLEQELMTMTRDKLPKHLQFKAQQFLSKIHQIELEVSLFMLAKVSPALYLLLSLMNEAPPLILTCV